MSKFRSKILSTLLLFLSIAGLSISCHKTEEPTRGPEEAFKAAYEKYRVSDDRQEKADLMEGFISAYPDAETTGRAIGMVIYNRYLLNNDPAGALAYLNDRLALAADPEVRKSIELLKLETLAELRDETAFIELTQGMMGQGRGLNSGEQRQVLVAASVVGAWELVNELSDSLLEKISETDDPIGRSEILMKKAGALHNLEMNDAALDLYQEAGRLAPRNFAGYYEYPAMELEYQWAIALKSARRKEEALKLIAPRVLLVREEDKELQQAYWGLFKELYQATGRDEASFKGFKEGLLQELSPTVPDFSAPDAGGTTRVFSGLKGKNATLLIFWFPT